MTYDRSGNLFFADAGRNRVFEITVGGVLATVAGNGEQGFSGDGGPAASATLNQPRGLVLGPDGSVYIADTANHRIRQVKNGTIVTIVGTGARGDSGDGGPATAATLDRPTALALDNNGQLFICDSAANRIRAAAGGLISGFAGNGVQGFAGDEGPALSASLDSPNGIAALPDGRVIISDTHNNRLRVVTADGAIRTFAGIGTRGYAGDGGPAVAAKLSMPQAVVAGAEGSILFADSGNQRLRAIDGAGKISTVAGTGVQGTGSDAEAAGTTALDRPKSLAISPFGAIAFSDSSKALLRAIAANGSVYVVPAPASRVSTVSLVAAPASVYGQTTATATVSAAASPQGIVSVFDNALEVTKGTIKNGVSSLDLATLAAGPHLLTANYAGDGINPEAVSSPSPVIVQPAPVIATADATVIAYGQSVPVLTGNVAGILPHDAGNVQATFSTDATSLSPVGTYGIRAALTGAASSNYSLSSGSLSGDLSIRQATSSVSLSAPAQTTYAGLPIVLTATIVPAYSGTPTGDVEFSEAGVVVARAPLVAGRANGSYLSPTAGSHTFSAAYAGDSNFLGNRSAPLTVSVNAVPDFAIVAASPQQSVQAGLSASYALTLTPQGGPFTGSVTFSLSGLPAGAQASFSPVAVVPGSSGAGTTLTVQTPAAHAELRHESLLTIAWIVLSPGVFFLFRRRPVAIRLAASCLFAVLMTASGCGARTTGTGETPSRSYALAVTATGTNLTGAIVSHSENLQLTVR